MIRIVRLTFKPEHIEAFSNLFNERKERIRGFEGCSLLELWQDKENPGIFYTYSLWDDHSNLDDYRLSAFFRETWSTVKTWFAAEPIAFSAYKIQQL